MEMDTKKQIRGSTPNAIKIRNQSFHLRFNERYQKKHLDFIIKIIKKVSTNLFTKHIYLALI